ncbi:MAG: DUF1232 domain-containing protein [Treponema sp.]|nr:DUF1232 domain-containing protein [Treponema sp.]
MKIKQRLEALGLWAKRTIGTLYYLTIHPETPKLAKVVAIIALAYALSPIDLVPDFIPILGYLDDLIILPLLVGLAIKLVPQNLFQVCEAEAQEHPVSLKKQWGAAVFIILFWLVIIGLILKTILAGFGG